MKLTIEQIALIDQIRQGTPLENDIDDVDLLNKVLHEASHPICEATGRYKFYFLNGDDWCSTDEQKPNAIKLSAFKTKMVSVDELREWIEAQSNVYKAIPIDQLLTFLNEKGI